MGTNFWRATPITRTAPWFIRELLLILSKLYFHYRYAVNSTIITCWWGARAHNIYKYNMSSVENWLFLETNTNLYIIDRKQLRRGLIYYNIIILVTATAAKISLYIISYYEDRRRPSTVSIELTPSLLSSAMLNVITLHYNIIVRRLYSLLQVTAFFQVFCRQCFLLVYI